MAFSHTFPLIRGGDKGAGPSAIELGKIRLDQAASASGGDELSLEEGDGGVHRLEERGEVTGEHICRCGRSCPPAAPRWHRWRRRPPRSSRRCRG